ncbi:MAG: hypothetical protein AAF739_16000 [Pseudomonadota bacterium]
MTQLNAHLAHAYLNAEPANAYRATRRQDPYAYLAAASHLKALNNFKLGTSDAHRIGQQRAQRR